MAQWLRVEALKLNYVGSNPSSDGSVTGFWTQFCHKLVEGP